MAAVLLKTYVSLKKKLNSPKSAVSSREFTSRNEAQASKPQKARHKAPPTNITLPCSREFTSRNKAQASKPQKARHKAPPTNITPPVVASLPRATKHKPQKPRLSIHLDKTFYT